MPYRAMALVAASLLFATQSYAATVNTSKSNNYKQAPQPGGGKEKAFDTSKSNNFRQGSTTSGGGAGAAKSTNINNSKSNNFRMGGGGGGKGASGNAVKLNSSRSN